MANKKCTCPSCGGEALIAGDEITCETCDAVYTITEKGARVKEVGAIDQIRKDIDGLKQQIAQPAAGDPPADPQIDDDEENDGFLSW